MTNSNLIKISFIIPMLNEESNLPNLFKSIGSQSLSNNIKIMDIIAIDNGSVDNSLNMSREYCSAVYVRPNDTIAEMRNYGASHSSGDILIFLDADCVLASDVAENVVKLFSDPQVSAVGPDGLIPVGKGTWVQHTWYQHTKVMGKKEQSIEVENLSSGFLAVKSNDFSAVCGFNGALSIGEDTDISRRMRSKGFKLFKSNMLHVFNSGHPSTISAFIKREFWHGDSLSHLLIHKKIELLTIYFISNAIAILCALASIILLNSLTIFAIYIVVFSLIPMLKAIKKGSKSGIYTFRLFILYLFYINARSASLFKFRGSK